MDELFNFAVALTRVYARMLQKRAKSTQQIGLPDDLQRKKVASRIIKEKENGRA